MQTRSPQRIVVVTPAGPSRRRRPRWPAVLMISGIVLAALWVGLALGGWVPAGPLAPLRDWLLELP